MSAADAIRSGRAYVEIGGDNASLIKSLAQSSHALKKWGDMATAMGKKLMAAGTAIGAPLALATQAYASLGAELARGALRAGVSVEAYSGLKYAAEQSGVSAEMMEKSIGKLSRKLVEAAKGSPEAVQAFQELGLKISDLAKMSPEQKLGAIGDALAKIKSPDLQKSLTEQLFGRGGLELLPMLAQGSAGISKFTARAKELGLVVSGPAAAAALEFDQRLSDLWAVAKMGAFQIGGALLPVVRPLALAMTNAAKAAGEFIQQHQGLVIAAAATAAGLFVAGAAVYGFGVAMESVGAIMGAIVTGVGIAGTLFAAVTSPLGLIVIGAAAAVAALLKFTNVGSEIAGAVSPVLRSLASDATAAFSGIHNAMAGGDFLGAVRILWTTIKVEWDKGVIYVAQAWAKVIAPFHGVISVMSTAWHAFTRSVVEAWTLTSSLVARAWGVTGQFLSSHFGGMWDGFKRGLYDVAAGAVYAFSAIEAVATHLGQTLKLMWVGIQLGAVKYFENLKYYWTEVFPTALGWAAANGPKIVAGMYLKMMDLTINFFKRLWDFVKDFAPKIGKMLWDAIKGGASAGEAFQDKFVDAFKRGYAQDVEQSGLPQFRERQKSETEKRLEGEAAALGGPLADEIDKAYQKNMDAVKRHMDALKRLRDKLTAGAPVDDTSVREARDDLAKTQKTLDELLAKATSGANSSGVLTPPSLSMQKFDPDAAAGALASIRKTSTAGTFLGSAAWGLGGPGQDQVAKNTKEANELLKTISDNIKKYGNKPGGIRVC